MFVRLCVFESLAFANLYNYLPAAFVFFYYFFITDDVMSLTFAILLDDACLHLQVHVNLIFTPFFPR